MNHTIAYVMEHWTALGGYVVLLISAAIKTLPIPGQPWNLYTFLYDWSHQFLNITNTRLSGPVTTPPDSAKPVQP